ncbi:HD domain-containing protein [Bacillus atrophaeus]|uniref:HD domain-containing protein n=1 Tax=Bacillus atrophaeus TaxID=1452 RepID=UPI002281745B|nr:HD domain-containing protein [Bacillus atrophaeus]MCY9164348.1 HD domain-containing protein [Bacillus atrophaeus]
MKEQKSIQLEHIRQWVKEALTNERTGHDWQHVTRVAELALYIGKTENADLFIIEASALVHDLIDAKIALEHRLEIQEVKEQLASFGVSHEQIRQIADIITTMSFRDRERLAEKPLLIEGKVVQDADRLDAIGAVGIARTFMFAGAKGNSLYGTENSAYAHFSDKLLLLKDMMNTETGIKLADKRHEFLLRFIRQFQSETSGLDCETS